MDLENLLGLPFEFQLSLAFGYTTYLISYLGIKHHHKSADTFFIVIVYSTIFYGTLLMLKLRVGFIPSIFFTCILVLATGIFWRMLGRALLYKFAHKLDLSWSSDDPSAWFTIYSDVLNTVSQISVEIDDGRILECRDTSLFMSAPQASCLLGAQGDIALHVTHETLVDGQEKTLHDIERDGYGTLITYIPAARVRTVSLRRCKK